MRESQTRASPVCRERLQIRRRRRKKVRIGDRQPLLKPMVPNEVWSADFVFDRTAEGLAGGRDPESKGRRL